MEAGTRRKDVNRTRQAALVAVLAAAVAASALVAIRFLTPGAPPTESPGSADGRPAGDTRLRIESDPRAAVYVDGQYQGLTPLALTGLAPGPHALHLSRNGYEPHRERVVLAGTVSRSIRLAPQAPARLAVRTRPPGAEVFLDGVPRGRTPCAIEDLAPGAYHLAVLLTDHVPAHESVDLSAGEEKTVNLGLEHRQERVLRAQIAADANDLSARVQLAELLHALGRHDESAQAFVQAFVVASQRRHWPQVHEREVRGLEGYTIQKLRDRPFREALADAVVEAVARGEDARLVLHHFAQVPWQPREKAYRQAIEGLVAHHAREPQVLIRASGFYRPLRAVDRAAELLDEAVRLAPQGAQVRVDVVNALNDLLEIAPRADLRTRQAEHLAALEKMRCNRGQQAQVLYERARFAYLEGRFDEGLTRHRAALEAMQNQALAATWRLDLAQRLLRRGDREAAAGELRAVLRTTRENDPAHRKADRLLDELNNPRRRGD